MLRNIKLQKQVAMVKTEMANEVQRKVSELEEERRKYEALLEEMQQSMFNFSTEHLRGWSPYLQPLHVVALHF